MWFFIVFTQLLALITSTILWWLIRPKTRRSQLILVASVFSINNIVLAYGLSEFWGERFHVYLVGGILQGFMGYALLITAAIALFYNKGLKKHASPVALRATAVGIYLGIVSLAVFNAYSPVVRHVTVSIGYSQLMPNDTPSDVIDRADEALYFAKRNGRNQSACFEHLLAEGKIAPKISAKGEIELF